MQQVQGANKPYCIVATDDRSVLSAVTRVLVADKATFCCAARLPQLTTLLEETLRQIVILDMASWGTHLAAVLSDHVSSRPDCSCICLVTEGQMAEIRAADRGGRLRLVARDRLQKELPAVLRQCAETQRMHRQMEELLRLEKQSLYNTISKEAEGMKPEDRSIFEKNITRRSFLKGAAAAAAAAGVAMSGGMKLLAPAEATPGEAENVEQVYLGVCRGNCGLNCGMKVHVRNGRLVKTSKMEFPVPDFERICQRGLTHNQRAYQPDRLTHPLRRVGERGSGQWEQITWDEAINEICEKWKKYEKEYGGASIAYFEGGGTTAPEVDYYMRLFNLMGATHIHRAYDRALLDSLPNVLGMSSWYIGNDPRSMQHSKYIFAWGANMTESGNVIFAQLQAALDAGAKLIVIDPNYTIGASKADRFIPIRPATDAILAFAMINIAVSEGKADENNLRYGTVAPFLVKKSDGKYLRLSDLGQAEAGSAEDKIVVHAEDGTVGLPGDVERPVINGSFHIQGHDVTTAYDLLLERVKEWTPERASEICDIPIETIYELAHMYMDGPSSLYLAYGQDHWGNGHTFYYAVAALAMVTGQIGKLGAGIHGVALNMYIGASAGSASQMLRPEGAVPGPEIYAPLFPGAVQSGKYGNLDVNIKSLFIYKHNMLGNQTGRKEWFKALNQIELIVTPEVVMTETTKYADIVLPVPHFFEVETFLGYGYGLLHNAKAIEPPGEAVGDFEIATLLGRGMGYEDRFTMTREQFFDEMYNNDNARAAGISPDTLREKGHIWMFNPDNIAIHGGNYAYGTTTRRGQFYREGIRPTTNFGQPFDREREALPYWIPPLEGWAVTADKYQHNPLAEKYPLIFMSERHKFRSHTSYTHNPWHLELQPEPTIAISTQDAEARGIRHGDIVKLYNDRGYLVIKAVINAGIRPGVVVIDHGWQEDEFIDGHYTDLSSCATSDVIINNAYFDCLVQAEKV